MITKDGKLLILDDVVCNKNYSKYKRLTQEYKGSIHNGYHSSTITSENSESDMDVAESNELEANEHAFEDVVFREELIELSNSLAKKTEEKKKEGKEFIPEEYAYGIITSIDGAYLDDRYKKMSNVIPAKLQTYWNGIEVELNKKLPNNKISKVYEYLLKKVKNLLDPKKMSVIEMMIEMKDRLEALGAEKDTIDILVAFINRMKEIDNNPSILQAAIRITVLENEKRILSHGKFLKYVSENQAVKLIKNTEIGLALDYLSNYTRVVPKEALDKFSEAEKTEAFDNYVILHYVDIKERYYLSRHHSVQDKKRDPIMFGLIKGSRKLYYICDWTDEYCNLTLSSFMSEIGDTEFNLTD